MSKYTLLGKSVSFSDSADEFCKVQFLAWDLSAKCKNEFNAWYDSKGEIYPVLKDYFTKLQSLIEKQVLSVYFDMLPSYKIYDVSRELFFKRCLNLDPADDAFSHVSNQYTDIVDQYEEEVEYRAERKDSRGRVIGGGFGVGGAIKGMATAGAMNAVTGAGHSIVNAVGNASSKSNMESSIKSLYANSKALLCNAIPRCVYAACEEFIKVVNEKVPNKIKSSFNHDESNAFLESAQKVPDEEISLLVSSFEKCPWNDDLYKYIFNKYEDERINLVKISKDFKVDLSTTIEDLLSSLCDKKEVFEDEAYAKDVRSKLLKIMSDLDVKDSNALNVLEQTWLLKLCEGYEKADEATLNEMKAKVNAYEALDSNKKVVTDMLQSLIEKIWAKEDNEIFDNYLLQTDILNADAVSASIEYINGKGRTASKETYLTAFKNINLKNVKKAKTYNGISGKGFKSLFFNYIGYLLIGIGVVVIFASDEPPFWSSTFLIIAGIIYEIYINSLKKMWKILTINGKVVHDVFKADKQTFKQFISKATIK